MNKKGFTLIEVLGVIILLGVLSMITVPVVRDLIKSSRDELYEEQIEQIENGLKNWAHDNIFLLPEDNSVVTLSLGQLAQSGHVNYKIENPKNNKCFSTESELTITKYNNNYVYEVKDISDVDCDDLEELPTIKLNGNVVEYLNIGDDYTEIEVSAKSYDGEYITDSVTQTITGDGTSISTSAPATYNITYKVNDNGKIMSAIRTIIVK